jgi:hypothetical protein
MIKLLQKHTIDLYSLEEKKHEKVVIQARELLSTKRFDLFAKLAYIRYRKENPELGIRIYKEHIKAFNPNLKEPGREDKNNFNDFINTYNSLIDCFEKEDFDENTSLIPVSGDNIILDGSHRVASLIYFNKNVSILKFNDVFPNCHHDYLYFFKRGVSKFVMDRIAFEAANHFKDLYIACLWPKLGNRKDRKFAIDYFNQNFDVLYQKDTIMSLSNLSRFIKTIYKAQSWTNSDQNVRDKSLNCYGKNKLVQFVVFRAKSLDEVLIAKDNIRDYYKIEKHALHITDDMFETKELMELVLTDKVKLFTSKDSRILDDIKTIIEFRKSYWILFKVKVYILLNKVVKLKK